MRREEKRVKKLKIWGTENFLTVYESVQKHLFFYWHRLFYIIYEQNFWLMNVVAQFVIMYFFCIISYSFTVVLFQEKYESCGKFFILYKKLKYYFSKKIGRIVIIIFELAGMKNSLRGFRGHSSWLTTQQTE